MHLHNILSQELTRFGDAPLRVVETGTIRDEREETGLGGDGWSTTFFAERDKKTNEPHTHMFVSIDLDTSIAESVLRAKGLRDHVQMIRGYSVSALGALLGSKGFGTYDVAFLDSDNNAQLIFDEFLIAQHLVRAGGLIIVDDVRMPHQPEGAHKGDIVLPHVQKREYFKHQLFEREGWRGYKCGVLVIQNVPTW